MQICMLLVDTLDFESVESIIMCAVWTLTCVYMVLFLTPMGMHACMHGCQEWGAEFSLHVNWSMLFAVYLCLSGSGIRGVCFFQLWGVTYWLIQALWVQVMQKVHTPTHMYAFECICVCSWQCGVMSWIHESDALSFGCKQDIQSQMQLRFSIICIEKQDSK